MMMAGSLENEAAKINLPERELRKAKQALREIFEDISENKDKVSRESVKLLVFLGLRYKYLEPLRFLFRCINDQYRDIPYFYEGYESDDGTWEHPYEKYISCRRMASEMVQRESWFEAYHLYIEAIDIFLSHLRASAHLRNGESWDSDDYWDGEEEYSSSKFERANIGDYENYEYSYEDPQCWEEQYGHSDNGSDDIFYDDLKQDNT